jgi:hypothetical protein
MVFRMIAVTMRIWLFAAAAALMVAGPALAQSPSGAIAGKVVDNIGAVLPGVIVGLASPEAAVLRTTTVTDINGAYSFGGLSPANYFLTFDLPGFETQRVSVALSAAQAVQLNMRMAVASFYMGGDIDRFFEPLEVSAGYSFVHGPRADTNLAVGWMVSRSVSLFRQLAAVGEVGGNYRTAGASVTSVPANVHAAMGGVRTSTRTDRLTGFGQLLAGVARTSDSSVALTKTTYSLALQPGVGIDCRLNWRLAFRTEADARFFRGDSIGNNAGRDYRLTTAIVYRFVHIIL